MTMKSRTELNEKASEIDVLFPTGIYYLLRGETVVYVGKSINPLARIGMHFQEKRKMFDRFYIEKIPIEDLDRTAASEIVRLRPEYNSTVPHGNIYTTMTKIKEMTGLGTVQIKRKLRQHNVEPEVIYGQMLYKLEEVAKIIWR